MNLNLPNKKLKMPVKLIFLLLINQDIQITHPNSNKDILNINLQPDKNSTKTEAKKISSLVMTDKDTTQITKMITIKNKPHMKK